MSRCVYFAGSHQLGFQPEDTAEKPSPVQPFGEYFEIYERYLKKPLRDQSIKQMECTAHACYLLTTEMSQVFLIGHKTRIDHGLKNVMSPISSESNTCESRSSDDRDGAGGSNITHLVALDNCCINLIGTGIRSTFYYSHMLNRLWSTGGDLVNNSTGSGPRITQVELPIELHSKEIVKMNGTHQSMLFLTADGLLFALGQFSPSKTMSRVVIPGIMDDNNSAVFVTDVQSGWAHALVLLSNGECYGIGSSPYGQLTSKGDKDTFTLCNVPGKITWIRACFHHSFFGTDDGSVYTCGHNDNYRLALNCSRTCIPYARPLNFPKGQVKHVFGSKDTIIVDQQNVVYVTGSSHGGCWQHKIPSSMARKLAILTRPVDMIQQISSGDFRIGFASSVTFSFLHLKPAHPRNVDFSKKLLFAQRKQQLLDIDIITQDDESL